jgi:MFS transporter, DHA2 family, multidrug resistance protein
MALGFALMGWSIGPAFGPLMGGTLLETAPWRIVYAVTLPLSGVGLLLAWWWLPPLRRRLDVLGVALLAVAVSTLLVALTQGNRDGWDAPYILTLLAVAGVTAVAFVGVQWCRAGIIATPPPRVLKWGDCIAD